MLQGKVSSEGRATRTCQCIDYVELGKKEIKDGTQVFDLSKKMVADFSNQDGIRSQLGKRHCIHYFNMDNPM